MRIYRRHLRCLLTFALIQHVLTPGSPRESVPRPFDEGVELTDAESQQEIDAVIADVGDLGGDGGVIVVTPEGHALYSMNTAGMYRGRATSTGGSEVAIYADEE